MRLLFLLFFLQHFYLKAQTFQSDKFGLSAGIVLNVGTHVNSIGLSVKTYYSDYFYQFNVGSSVTWNLKSYGERQKYWESRSYFGLVLLGGTRDNTIDFHVDGLNHQTNYTNGIAYNYLWYYDNAGTSQLSGAFALHLDKLSICFENDLFAGQGKDRFRTASLFFNYRYDLYKFGAGINLWTGETNGVPWEGIGEEGTPYGYKRLNTLPYGKTSHGIVCATASYYLGYGQFVNSKIGMDDEQIRHVIQNKIIHDLVFLPKSVKHNTPHYPRLNEEGMPIFDKSQKRKSKFYYQLGMND